MLRLKDLLYKFRNKFYPAPKVEASPRVIKGTIQVEGDVRELLDLVGLQHVPVLDCSNMVELTEEELKKIFAHDSIFIESIERHNIH